MNESTFKRSPHDKKNPYVMISREMAQDKSISPKAKGVLLYLLSLPDDWQIYHSQLQDGLGVGEEYVNSAIEELLNNGYAERTREKVKGMFQPYQYTIYEFKISLPNRENQAGSSGPENPALHNTHSLSEIHNKQQHAALAAAVFFDQSNKKSTPTGLQKNSESKKSNDHQMKIWECLKDIDIPMKDKVEISARYDEETIKNAVAWAKHPSTVINKSLAAALKWACQNNPEITKSKEENEQLNKEYAMRYDGRKTNTTEIVCCNKYVEIIQPGACNTGTYLEYGLKDFMNKFNEMLKIYKFCQI